MATAVFIFLLLVLGVKIFYKNQIPLRKLPYAIQTSFRNPTQKESWVFIAFFLVVLFFPLVSGLEFFLRTDWNAFVVIFFLFWAYQWSRIVWYSEKENP